MTNIIAQVLIVETALEADSKKAMQDVALDPRRCSCAYLLLIQEEDKFA